MSDKEPLKTGLLYLFIRLPMVMLIALLVHVLMATHVWDDKHLHLKMILDQDMKNIESLSNTPESFARVSSGATYAYDLIFNKTGFNHMIEVFAQPVHLNPFDTEARKVVVYFWDEIQAAMYSVQIIGERLTFLTLMLPLFVLVSLIAISDGWVSRWLRRAFGGRESAFLYHRLKRGIFLSIVSLWAVYLIMPASPEPRTIVFIFLLIYGFTLRFTISYFKKYF